jgi:4-oxalocrotonate tautomerase family enzyme
MPHVVIKTLSGATKEQLQKAAEQVSDVINKTLGKPKKYISVSFEEYSFDEWESVYNEFIDGRDNVLVKPGYTNPKTFQ